MFVGLPWHGSPTNVIRTIILAFKSDHPIPQSWLFSMKNVFPLFLLAKSIFLSIFAPSFRHREDARLQSRKQGFITGLCYSLQVRCELALTLLCLFSTKGRDAAMFSSFLYLNVFVMFAFWERRQDDK